MLKIVADTIGIFRLNCYFWKFTLQLMNIQRFRGDDEHVTTKTDYKRQLV